MSRNCTAMEMVVRPAPAYGLSLLRRRPAVVTQPPHARAGGSMGPPPSQPLNGRRLAPVAVARELPSLQRKEARRPWHLPQPSHEELDALFRLTRAWNVVPSVLLVLIGAWLGEPEWLDEPG